MLRLRLDHGRDCEQFEYLGYNRAASEFVTFIHFLPSVLSFRDRQRCHFSVSPLSKFIAQREHMEERETRREWGIKRQPYSDPSTRLLDV